MEFGNQFVGKHRLWSSPIAAGCFTVVFAVKVRLAGSILEAQSYCRRPRIIYSGQNVFAPSTNNHSGTDLPSKRDRSDSFLPIALRSLKPNFMAKTIVESPAEESSVCRLCFPINLEKSFYAAEAHRDNSRCISSLQHPQSIRFIPKI